MNMSTIEDMVAATIVEVSRLELGPTDTLVIRLPHLSRAEDRMIFLDNLVANWVNAPRGRIIVIPKEIELEVLKQPVTPEWK